MKVLHYFGLGLSFLVGVWHFFVPTMFDWFSYLPTEYENLTVGIIYTNYCFSLLLSGLSLLLIIFGKRTLSGNKEWLIVLGFLVFVWLNRAAITFIVPWPLEPVAWVAHTQQIASVLIFTLLLLSVILLTRNSKRQESK